MNHAGAQKLDPALALADAAALSMALKALHIDLAGRLGKGEMVGAETRLCLRPVQPFYESVQGALQIAHSYALVHDKAFHLVEYGRVRSVGLILAVDFPGDIILIGGFSFSIT